jgi:hypothetical protein
MLAIGLLLLGLAGANVVQMVRGGGEDAADGGGLGMPAFNMLPGTGRFLVRVVLTIGMALVGIYALMQL